MADDDFDGWHPNKTVTVGGFIIEAGTPEDKVYLEDEASGEAGNFSAAQFGDVVRKFFDERF